MKLKELLLFMQEKQKKEKESVVSFSDIIQNFSGEKKSAITQQLHRFVKDGVLVELCKGYYASPFLVQEKPETILIKLARKLRPDEHYYLSLEYRAWELSMITQMPNGYTFVTDGKSYTYKTAVGMIHFTQQSGINLENDPELEFDRSRGIYVASEERVVKDAKRHHRFGLLDLIEELKYKDEELNRLLTGKKDDKD